MTEHFQFAQPEWLYALPFILCLIILRRRRGAEGSITYPTVRFIASLARAPQSLAGKIEIGRASCRERVYVRV